MPLDRELEANLHSHIPMSAYMVARVFEASDEGFRLTFPLEPNFNHRDTVFGGSESSSQVDGTRC